MTRIYCGVDDCVLKSMWFGRHTYVWLLGSCSSICIIYLRISLPFTNSFRWAKRVWVMCIAIEVCATRWRAQRQKILNSANQSHMNHNVRSKIIFSNSSISFSRDFIYIFFSSLLFHIFKIKLMKLVWFELVPSSKFWNHHS